MTSKIKVTLHQLKEYLKNKRDRCNKPHGRSIAEDLLNDPNHPVSTKSDEDFSLSNIFDYVDVIDDNTNRFTSEH